MAERVLFRHLLSRATVTLLRGLLVRRVVLKTKKILCRNKINFIWKGSAILWSKKIKSNSLKTAPVFVGVYSFIVHVTAPVFLYAIINVFRYDLIVN